MRLFRHWNILELDYYSHGGGCRNEWLPLWFYLPTDVQRPSSTTELAYLARELINESVGPGERPLLAKLADPAFARTFYADAAAEQFRQRWRPRQTASTALDWEHPTAWVDVVAPDGARGPDVGLNSMSSNFSRMAETVIGQCPLFDDASERARDADPTGFDSVRLEARQAAAGWRISCALNWTRWLMTDPCCGFDAIQWRLRECGVDMDDVAIQAYLGGQVAATDQMVLEIKRMLRHAVVSGDHWGKIWVLGLSPNGHLVGAVSYISETD